MADMPAKVPMMAIGRAMAGMNVAETVRRKTKITAITRKAEISNVACTSFTERRIELLLSSVTATLIEGGRWARSAGSAAWTASTTATVLAPGWRLMATVTAGT